MLEKKFAEVLVVDGITLRVPCDHDKRLILTPLRKRKRLHTIGKPAAISAGRTFLRSSVIVSVALENIRTFEGRFLNNKRTLTPEDLGSAWISTRMFIVVGIRTTLFTVGVAVGRNLCGEKREQSSKCEEGDLHDVKF